MASDKKKDSTLPNGWTAEEETIDHIRLEGPPESRNAAAAYLDAIGYDRPCATGPIKWEGSTVVGVQILRERASAAVPLALLVVWLKDAKAHRHTNASDAILLSWLQEQALEKWGGKTEEEAES